MNTILLIEDHEMNRDMLSRRLRRKGYVVLEAEDGESGLILARETSPCLVLMDMGLPGITGWEATKQLKHDPRTKDIPIIGLSAHAMSGDRHLNQQRLKHNVENGISPARVRKRCLP